MKVQLRKWEDSRWRTYIKKANEKKAMLKKCFFCFLFLWFLCLTYIYAGCIHTNIFNMYYILNIFIYVYMLICIYIYINTYIYIYKGIYNFQGQYQHFVSTKNDKQRYTNITCVILIITSFFSNNELLGRNSWILLTVGHFFGKFNAYFKQRNEKKKRFSVKDWCILLFPRGTFRIC